MPSSWVSSTFALLCAPVLARCTNPTLPTVKANTLSLDALPAGQLRQPITLTGANFSAPVTVGTPSATSGAVFATVDSSAFFLAADSTCAALYTNTHVEYSTVVSTSQLVVQVTTASSDCTTLAVAAALSLCARFRPTPLAQLSVSASDAIDAGTAFNTPSTWPSPRSPSPRPWHPSSRS